MKKLTEKYCHVLWQHTHVSHVLSLLIMSSSHALDLILCNILFLMTHACRRSTANIASSRPHRVIDLETNTGMDYRDDLWWFCSPIEHVPSHHSCDFEEQDQVMAVEYYVWREISHSQKDKRCMFLLILEAWKGDFIEV